MATLSPRQKATVSTRHHAGRPALPPSVRNCAIYERLRIENETHARVAADYGLSRQRVATIVAQVESWLAAHPTHLLAQKMRVRCGKRWETLWNHAIEAFDRSRQDRETKKTRTVRRAARGGDAADVVTTITEHTVREQNGDPRYLNVARRVAEREDRLWMVQDGAPVAGESPRRAGAAHGAGRPSDADATADVDSMPGRSPEAIGAGQRFTHLPAGLCDLAHLACGLRNATEHVPEGGRNGTESVVDGERGDGERNGTESVSDGERNGAESVPDGERNGIESAPNQGHNGTEDEPSGVEGSAHVESRSRRGIAKALPQPLGEIENSRTPVSTLFERRCAEAFRCLGFEVRELGQGCGRTADCLAVAVAERFAVIIDAKVRRGGYTLGTDDRQFCEYATRHCRELAQSGIERVYFAVVGRGFRQADLDKLAGFMTGTPIRSVVFIEAEALMRLVGESIRRRREFRLAEIDQRLFGNKIIDAA